MHLRKLKKMKTDEVIKKLKSMESPKGREGMARFGINPEGTLGVSIYKLRPMAKELGKDHKLAKELWASGIHDARLLAVFVDDPRLLTEDQMDAWAKDFDSWDVCDQACTSLFDQSPLAWKKAGEWAKRKEEYVKRGAFALMAGLAVHDKKASDKEFEKLLGIIESKEAATDERNYVRKAASWALRNIGKMRNAELNKKAIETAKGIRRKYPDSKAAKWIATDAIRELESEAVKARLKKKGKIRG